MYRAVPHRLAARWLLVASLCAAAFMAHAQAQVPKPLVSMQTAPAANHDMSSWVSLTASQQQALAPLAAEWPALDNSSRDKWLNVADRFTRLSPQAQQRMHSRMTQWARLPAKQRGEARLRYQNARQLDAQERQKKWAAYQALPTEERQGLAQQARRKHKPVVLPDSEPGPREAAQLSNERSHTHASSGHAAMKSNLVPNAARTTREPESVAPSLVAAGQGATTSLVNQTASPPLHQHTGLSKINAAKGFVDPQTLLPRRGPQSAAMTPVSPTPAAQQTSATVGKP